MDKNKTVDRFSIIRNVIIIAFIIIIGKIIYMTTYEYEYYNEQAQNKTFRNISIEAPRGDIRDKYGKLIAGTTNIFTVQISGNTFNSSEVKERANDISLQLINILENNNEEYIDEFPIKIENGKYYYTYDENIKEFKNEYESGKIPSELNAKETFYYIVDDQISKGKLESSDRDLKAYEIQKKLNEEGVYPPILVSSWMFTEEKNKQDWLTRYRIKDIEITPKDAFDLIRDSYKIDDTLNSEDARKILVVRDLIKSQGYTQYNPITISSNIDDTTIAQIEEKAMDLPGVSVEREPIRYYPDGDLAFHTIGYVGEISQPLEERYLSGETLSEYIEKNPQNESLVTGKSYMKGDVIGLSGIEAKYEPILKGINGYKRVQVDALGNITQELEVVDPVAGETVYLSIDKEIQSKMQEQLEKVIKAANTAGTYKSDFGDYNISKVASNAGSGAVIAIDVNTGDVITTASYPTFDANKFVEGLSSDDPDYKIWNPDNKNNVLEPSAQTNLVTHGAFQPGSIFKMITGMAAIDNGLSPNYTIDDTGYTKYGDRIFADYIWHSYRGNHGYTNLYKAIQESCNMYFFTIGTGINFAKGADPDVKIGIKEVLEYADKFGLNDESTGLSDEISERTGSVPEEEDKTRGISAMLYQYLDEETENSFKDITKDSDKKEFERRIEEISGWTSEGGSIGRVEIINRLAELNIKEELVEPLADEILYSYLNFSKWGIPDAFNISIGQGENQYTPAQMARYIAAIANGGKLVDLSVVDRVIASDYKDLQIDENESRNIEFNDNNNLDVLTEGMKLVSTEGTGSAVFANFPIDVASKTGTAEKSGKIPTANEVEYLKSHMSSYGVSYEDASKLADNMIKIEEEEQTEEKIKEIKDKLKDKELEKEEREELEKQLEEGIEVVIDKNNTKIYSSYLRKAIKKLNDNIDDEDIDRFKEDYQSFSWSVGFAPADNPEIAVVAVIPQGGSSSNAMLLVRDAIGYYYGLDEEQQNRENEEEKDSEIIEDENINFMTNIKK